MGDPAKLQHKGTVLVSTGANGLSRFKSSNVNTGLTGIGNKLLSMIGATGSIQLTDDDPAPELKPTKQVIDVVNDFSWYAGPKSTPQALDKVPCAFIQEREQLLSSMVSGAMYYLDAASRILAGSSYHKESISSLVGEINDSIGNNLGSIGAQDLAIMNANNLNSLKGIYFTRDTGFNYRLPIYGQGLQKKQVSVWDGANSDSSSIAQTTVKSAQDMFRNVAEIINIGQPGVYIEEPKYFQGAEQGESRTITFPLANTVKRGHISPVQQNYELLWLLAFQNKPYKTSFSRTPPPKIYNVVVPGQFSFPYSYISNMNVEFVGTTRNTHVYSPAGSPDKSGGNAIGNKLVQTPVPEAYQVSITFTSLIGSYGNSMLSDSYNTTISNGRVNIGSASQ